MLKSLGIKNLGIIDGLSVEFGSGLNILTGETGAGKSMILSALNLVLGERADSETIRRGAQIASAEAVFEAEGIKTAAEVFREQDIVPEEGEYLIRRAIQREGKGKTLVNGNAINVSALKRAGETMVDIHGQHQHQALLRKDTHLWWLDNYLDLEGEAKKVSTLLSNTKRLQSELDGLLKKQNDMEAQKDFLEFRADELEKADIKPSEEEKLENEHKKLASADKIQATGSEIFSELYESDSSVISAIEKFAKEMEKLKSADGFFDEYSKIFSEAAAQLSDAAMEIKSFCSGVENDPARMEALESRMALLEKLKRKYKTDLPGLLELLESTKRELGSIENFDEERESLQTKVENSRNELQGAAVKLHKKRLKGIAAFKKEVQKELKDLNMPSGAFDVEITLPPNAPEDEKSFELDGKKTKIFPHGFGWFQFLFSANVGQPPKPLAKIASGGEISRVMLALKTATGKVQPVPILVFDEVDAGIGGKTADMVGEKLKKLSKNCQIFCITHLPQIARQADSHYVVAKETVNISTVVTIEKLDDKGRIEELARMGAGKVVTDAARKHAEEMISK